MTVCRTRWINDPFTLKYNFHDIAKYAPRVSLLAVQRMRRSVGWWWRWAFAVAALLRQSWPRRRRFRRRHRVTLSILPSADDVVVRVLIDALLQVTVRIMRTVLWAGEMSVLIDVGFRILAAGVSTELVLIRHRLMTTDRSFVLRLHRAVLATGCRILGVLIVLAILTVLSAVVLRVLAVRIIVTRRVLSRSDVRGGSAQVWRGTERSRRTDV